jgi:hypothetical protein
MTEVTFINRESVNPSAFETLVAALNNAAQCDAVDPKRARRWITDPHNPLQILRYLNYSSHSTGFTASFVAAARPRGHFLVLMSSSPGKRIKTKFIAVVDGFYLDSKRTEIGIYIPRTSRTTSRPSWYIELRPRALPGHSVPSMLARKVIQDVESLGQRFEFDILHVSHPDFFVLRGSIRGRNVPLRELFPSLRTPHGLLGIECRRLSNQGSTHDSATTKTGVSYHSQHVYRFVTVLAPLSNKVFVSFPLAGITVQLAPREVLIFTNIDKAGKAVPQASHSILSPEEYLKWHVYRH